MADLTIDVTQREKTGKNESRRMRKQGLVPGILYGEGKTPVPIAVEMKSLFKLLHSEKGVNTVAQGKRPASSMTPTIVPRDGALALVLGSPGGDTIPNTVAQVFRNVVDHGMTIDEAAAHGRIHHQYLPDQIRVERLKQPPKSALDDLVSRGHKLKLETIPIGHANVILVAPDGTFWGYADAREGGKALGIDSAAIVKPPPPAAPSPAP